MTTDDHEMESASSFGKDDDHDFAPKLLSKKSRTNSVLHAVRSVVTSRVVTPTDDPRKGKFDKQPPVEHFRFLGSLPVKPTYYAKLSNGCFSTLLVHRMYLV
jgi:hypothetical protein